MLISVQRRQFSSVVAAWGMKPKCPLRRFTPSRPIARSLEQPVRPTRDRFSISISVHLPVCRPNLPVRSTATGTQLLSARPHLLPFLLIATATSTRQIRPAQACSSPPTDGTGSLRMGWWLSSSSQVNAFDLSGLLLPQLQNLCLNKLHASSTCFQLACRQDEERGSMEKRGEAMQYVLCGLYCL